MSTESKFAEPFREMAARIERIFESEFSGAILIVPPTGETIAVVIADPKKDLDAFWAVANSKIEIGMAEHKAQKSGGFQGFPR